MWSCCTNISWRKTFTEVFLIWLLNLCEKKQQRMQRIKAFHQHCLYIVDEGLYPWVSRSMTPPLRHILLDTKGGGHTVIILLKSAKIVVLRKTTASLMKEFRMSNSLIRHRIGISSIHQKKNKSKGTLEAFGFVKKPKVWINI